jgi:hypothetical protein
MSDFPLYQDLVKNIEENKVITDEDKNDLIKKIKKVDENGHELIYALIRKYQLQNENGFGLPYEGKMMKLGLKFDLENIPDNCIQLLILFCDKHLEKMKEEQKLLKNRK